MKSNDLTIRVNFTLPESLYEALKNLVPKRQRSKVVANLISKEIKKREASLSSIAQSVEKDKALNQEMKAWDSTFSDGMDNWEWK